MITAQPTATFEELDYRESDGLEISLLWSRADNSLSVVVVDTKSDTGFELPVKGDEALDVFHHPFAYAATRIAEPVLAASAPAA